jgi:hypothetical protein
MISVKRLSAVLVVAIAAPFVIGTELDRNDVVHVPLYSEAVAIDAHGKRVLLVPGATERTIPGTRVIGMSDARNVLAADQLLPRESDRVTFLGLNR